VCLGLMASEHDLSRMLHSTGGSREFSAFDGVFLTATDR
jgi:hypothetical protein